MIAFATLLDVNGNVNYDGITIKCKLLQNRKSKIEPLDVIISGVTYNTVVDDREVDFLRAEDIGKQVVIAYPKELEDAVIIGVIK